MPSTEPNLSASLPVAGTAAPAPGAELPAVSLMGMRLAKVDRHGLLDHMFAGLAAGRGGWLVTANMDFVRRYVHDPDSRALYDEADLRVADGTPLVWASRVQGDRLPGRVPGSSLIWLLAERAAREGKSLYLLGGTPSANAGAARVLAESYPGLALCGGSSPRVSSPPTPAEVDRLVDELVAARPDILLVGLGSPKQEHLIRALRARLPATWMIGVGITFSFVAGEIKRAPLWMRKTGIEWVHRMAQEPRRLAKRYLLHDLPFALRLFAHVLWKRWRG
jgi:N-acetylglucosaminyldiphosphoundecaprenol N-acetyl-beta-D-mannosaminyltransferase